MSNTTGATCVRSPLVFGRIRVAYSLVSMLCHVYYCLSFSFLAMALSVYFRFMRLTVPLVSYVSLLQEYQNRIVLVNV